MASAGTVMVSPQQSAEVPNTRNLAVGAGILGGGTLSADRTFTMGFASEAQGDIAIRGASAWARLAAGTTGLALITGGAGANPAWGANFGVSNLLTSGTLGAGAGTFTSLDAGSGTITTTGVVHGAGFAGAGANVAATGALRGASNVTIVAARNAANSADNVLVATDGSDDALFGDATNTPIVATRSTTNFQAQVGGAAKIVVALTTTTIVDPITVASGGPTIRSGANTPEGAITASVGSLFLRTNGGAVTTLYVKETGAGNTGWVAK